MGHSTHMFGFIRQKWNLLCPRAHNEYTRSFHAVPSPATTAMIATDLRWPSIVWTFFTAIMCNQNPIPTNSVGRKHPAKERPWYTMKQLRCTPQSQLSIVLTDVDHRQIKEKRPVRFIASWKPSPKKATSLGLTCRHSCSHRPFTSSSYFVAKD